MSFSFIYNNYMPFQNRKAELYTSKVKTEHSINGEKLEFHKIPIIFKCGEMTGINKQEQSLIEGLKVNRTSIVLFSTDHKIKDIKRGDKVIYENNTYSVESVNDVRKKTNNEFQRITNNKAWVITLT